MGLVQTATTTTIAANQSYQSNQLQAARDVNRIEYEQRVQALGAELTQVQLQRQQSMLQAQQQSQQNERSYTQGMYEVLKQRVAAQEQAFAGKEQGMQIQAETANQGTAQYQELLNAAFQLEAQQSQEQQKAAQASMFVDPLSVTSSANQASLLQNQVQAFMQNRMMNNNAIGDEQMQTEYATALSEVLRRLGINDSQLTGNMADQNSMNISQQRNQNAQQIQQQTALNNQAYSSAEQSLNNARGEEYKRFMSDDKNLVRLNGAQQQTQSRNNMSLSGYSYRDGGWYNDSSTPLLDAARSNINNQSQLPQSSSRLQQGQYSGNAYQSILRQPPKTTPNLYLGNGSSAKEELLKADPNAVIKMPLETQQANVSKPPESASGKKSTNGKKK